jgi:hypothetical protein
MLALLSITGCAQYVGKGKAPPLVVTKAKLTGIGRATVGW